MDALNHHQAPFQHDLILLGGGHSHVLALQRWVMNPEPGWRVTLVSEHSSSAYSGMLPGLVAGDYRWDQTQIDLRALCRRLGVRFIRAKVAGVSRAQRRVFLENRPALEFDALSLNVGGVPDLSVFGAAQCAVPVKPINGFWSRWQHSLNQRGLDQAATEGGLAVVGGGAGSVELILAMAERCPPETDLHLVCRAIEPLAEAPARLRARLRRSLSEAGVQVHTGFDVVRVEADKLSADDGRVLAVDSIFWCTGVRAPAWVEQSDLPLAQGFIQIGSDLSVGSDGIFAAGDCALNPQDPLPRAGVYAVRQSQVLADNWRRWAQNKSLKPYRPQRRFLSLLRTGPRQAVGYRKGLLGIDWVFQGHWVARWKQRIDARFMQRFQVQPEPPMNWDGDQLGELSQRCGGCAGKLGSGVIETALCDHKQEPGENRWQPEDASVLPWHADAPLIQSVDAIKALSDDPYQNACIATQHAASDVIAMNADVDSAQLQAQIPLMAERLQARDLRQVVAGVRDTLQSYGAELAGGHSLEADRLVLGLTVNGRPRESQPMWPKQGARQGDALLVTRSLGTGVVLAAAMQSAVSAAAVDAALASASCGNGRARSILQSFAGSVHAATDITGFGLLGHLTEMLGAGQGADIAGLAVSALPEALDTLAAGYRSSLAPANEAMLEQRVVFDSGLAEARKRLLSDPQTGGGLLLAVDAEAVEDLMRRAADTDECWSLIGWVNAEHNIKVHNRASLRSV